MEGERLGEKYAYVFKDLVNLARAENKIDETNIYQEANQQILPIVDKMLEENMLPGSRIEGMEHVRHFLDQIEAGKHGLLLCEHYSNFDLPGLHYLLRQAGEDGKILKQVPGKPIYTATLVKYAELMCARPCGQGALYGITEA